MVNGNAVLVNYLLEQAVLTDEVGTNVYAVRLPADFVPSGKGAVSLRTSTGDTDPNLPLVTLSVEIRGWHENNALQARKVYGLVHDVLHQVSNVDVPSTGPIGSIGSIVEALEELHGQDTWDPDTRWPFVLGSFSAILRN